MYIAFALVLSVMTALLLAMALRRPFAKYWVTQRGLAKRPTFWLRLLPWERVTEIVFNQSLVLYSGAKGTRWPCSEKFWRENKVLIRQVWRRCITGTGIRHLPARASRDMLLWELLPGAFCLTLMGGTLLVTEGQWLGAAAAGVFSVFLVKRWLWEETSRFILTTKSLKARGVGRRQEILWSEATLIRQKVHEGRGYGTIEVSAGKTRILFTQNLMSHYHVLRILRRICPHAQYIDENMGPIRVR